MLLEETSTGRDKHKKHDIRNTLVWLFILLIHSQKTPTPPKASKYHYRCLRQFVKWILKTTKLLKQTLSEVTADSECATWEIPWNLTVKCWAPAVWEVLKIRCIQITSVGLKNLVLKFSITSYTGDLVCRLVWVPMKKKLLKCNPRHYRHYQCYGFTFCRFSEVFPSSLSCPCCSEISWTAMRVKALSTKLYAPQAQRI